MKIEIPVSVGELVDKLTILRIKAFEVVDKNKLAAIENEKEFLEQIVGERLEWDDKLAGLQEQLSEVNVALWQVENELRDLERQKQFSNRFIELARTVYKLNDRRFVLKDTISSYAGSEIREAKSYAAY